MGSVKGRVTSLFKTNTAKDYSKLKLVKNVCGGVNKPRKLEKNETIKDRRIRDITTFEQLEEDYYKPVRVDNFYSNKYIEHESDGDRNKTPLIKEYNSN